jgi:hypothetical protein
LSLSAALSLSYWGYDVSLSRFPSCLCPFAWNNGL